MSKTTDYFEGYLMGLWIASMICEQAAGPNRHSSNSMVIMNHRATEQLRQEVHGIDPLYSLPEQAEIAA